MINLGTLCLVFVDGGVVKLYSICYDGRYGGYHHLRITISWFKATELQSLSCKGTWSVDLSNSQKESIHEGSETVPTRTIHTPGQFFKSGIDESNHRRMPHSSQGACRSSGAWVRYSSG
jgi:hypothetical protein